MPKQKVSSIQKKLLMLLIPLFSFAFLVLLIINFITNKNALTEEAERTLRDESSSNMQSITIDMLIATGVHSVSAAYTQLSASPFSLLGLYNKVENISVMDCGYAFLINTRTGRIIAHSDPKIKNTYLADLDPDSFLGQVAAIVNEQSAEGTQPIHILRDGGSGYYVIAQSFSEIPWVLISCLPENYVTDKLIPLYINLVIIVLFMLILTTVLVSLVVRRMTAPIKRLTGTLTDIADGDFTVDIRISGNDEITVMSRAMKEFISVMREVIWDIREVSDQLNDHSASTKKISDTLSDTSETQAESMGDMQVTLDQVAAAISDLAQHATALAQVADTVNQDGSADPIVAGEINKLADISASSAAMVKEILAVTQTLAEDSLHVSEESRAVADSADAVAQAAFILAEHMRRFKI